MPAGLSPKQIETSPPLELANSLLPQQPVNPHFLYVATFKKKGYLKVLDCPLSAQKFWASESERESA